MSNKEDITPKEYLRQALYLKQDIERKQNQIIELQSMAERTTGSYEALRVSGTTSHSKLEDAVVRLSEIGDELAEMVSQYREKYREISAVIDAVEDPTYRQLLSLRYLSFMTWEQVAVEMGYSYVHVVHRLHPKALNAVKILSM